MFRILTGPLTRAFGSIRAVGAGILKKRPQRYWIEVLVLTALGVAAGHWLADRGTLIQARYGMHQLLGDYLNPFPAQPSQTAIVVIGDEEFWTEELAGRRPVKREYLARLLRAIDKMNPRLIALDFDLSAPDPGSAQVPAEYRKETDELIMAIVEVAASRPLVIPRTLGRRDASGRRQLEADIYDGWKICPSSPSDMPTRNIYCGYIALPRDMRIVPPPLLLANGLGLDSFAVAIARAGGVRFSDSDAERQVGYGVFIPKDRFEQDRRVVLARHVLTGPRTDLGLEQQVVLIGGAWSRFARGRGGMVDSHATPVGDIPGVFVHASYAEMLLARRSLGHTPGWIALVIEVGLVLAAGLVFAADFAPRRRFGLFVLLVLSSVAVVLIFAYFAYQNFGVVFEPVIPMLIIGGHALTHQVREWQEDSAKYRALSEEVPK